LKKKKTNPSHNSDACQRTYLHSPFLKISMRWNGATKVLVKLLEYIHQTGRDFDSLRN